MDIKINDFIKSQDKTMYIDDDPSQASSLSIDCGEGINIMQIPPCWMSAIENLDLEYIRTYPHTPGLKEEIVHYWKECAAIDEENIFFIEGSMDGIRIACRVFLERGDLVLGNIPTFNAAEGEIKLSGAKYDGILLEEKQNYAFDCGRFLEKLNGGYKMVFLDNPNNPTGQVIPLEQIRKIVDKAAEYGIGVIVDEAYGDYMSKENSAANLLDRFENVAVLRTFSKGFGLAGMRIGYMITSGGQLSRAVSKVTDGYKVGILSRLLAVKALRDTDFLKRVNEEAGKLKKVFLEETWENLSISATGKNVPIMLLSHKETNVDLAGCLAEYGIKAISGMEFDGIGKNSVRFRVPPQKDLEEVLRALKEIDKR